MIHSREDLRFANRIVIKAGTSIVSTPDGYPSLLRMANIVEYTANLVREGKQVIIVTSGAVGVGKKRLMKQSLLRQSLSDVLFQVDPESATTTNDMNSSCKVTYSSAAAAAGQLALMSLYETMFSQYDIPVSQVLLTAFDFTSSERRRNVQHVISRLLSLGIIPLLNENDAVSANQGYQLYGNTFSDNDSLAALVGIELNAQLMILLTDVQGVFDRPPSDSDAKLIDVFDTETKYEIGNKSTQGRGGMGAKVDAALRGIQGGVQAVVIADGRQTGVIADIVRGKSIGTIFLKNGSTSNDEADCTLLKSSVDISHNNIEEIPQDIQRMAIDARNGSRKLQQLTSNERSNILINISKSLIENQEEIIRVNQLDISYAESLNDISPSNLKRLQLTTEKILTLAEGILSIAKEPIDPIGQILSKTEIASNLNLEKVTTPIGVLLIIFESRPDCLPQIIALAIQSGNGLLLKGGKEAEKTNNFLFNMIRNCIEEGSSKKIHGSVIGLVTSRAEVQSLLQLDKYIDLVIPRGSSSMVSYIKSNTKIPVLGHAEGICHVYLDEACNDVKAIRISIDSKTDYPAACNAAETLLIHKYLLTNGIAASVCRLLREAGVELLGTSKAIEYGLTTNTDPVDLKTEYGNMTMSVHVVDSIDEAIDHIHTYGSSHTECIVTESEENANEFIRRIDSACVFHNASTRFADGYRFGLGAEVGISTGRIHSRGPMGVEGLMTFKWILRSTQPHGDIVKSFSHNIEDIRNKREFTHKKII